jgi:hypothetical protein
MKTVYLEVTPAYHEQEELVFNYAVYDDEKRLKRDTLYFEYRKPAIAPLFGVMQVLKELKTYQKDEILFIVNDGALVEQLKGTTTTKNADVLKVAELARKHVLKFSNQVSFKSIAGEYQAMLNWESKLLP